MQRIPTHNVLIFKKIVWSSVSNAFNKSRNILMGNWLLSKCVVILSTISRAAYSVEWWGLKQYWLSDSFLSNTRVIDYSSFQDLK